MKAQKSEFDDILLSAWSAFALGEFEIALDILSYQPDTLFHKALFSLQRAIMFERLKKIDKAEQAYREAVLALPPRWGVQNFAHFLQRQGRHQEALELYQTVKQTFDNEEGPDARLIEQALKQLEQRKSPPPLPSIRQTVSQGLIALGAIAQQHNLNTYAFLHFMLALYLDKKSNSAKALLASSFHDMNRYEEALALYESVDQKSLYAPASVLDSARILYQLGEHEKALQRAYKASQQGDSAALRLYANFLQEQERYQEAETVYTHLIETTRDKAPRLWQYYFGRGVVRGTVWKLGTGRTGFEICFKTCPLSSPYHELFRL